MQKSVRFSFNWNKYRHDKMPLYLNMLKSKHILQEKRAKSTEYQKKSLTFTNVCKMCY